MLINYSSPVRDYVLSKSLGTARAIFSSLHRKLFSSYLFLKKFTSTDAVIGARVMYASFSYNKAVQSVDKTWLPDKEDTNRKTQVNEENDGELGQDFRFAHIQIPSISSFRHFPAFITLQLIMYGHISST